MSSSPLVRTLRLPPPDFDHLEIPRTCQPVRDWFRVHRTLHSARHFSINAAHRFSHLACPCAVLYLGVNLDTCLFERFGDEAYDSEKAISRALWDVHSASSLRVPEINVCDLTRPETLSALRVDLTALMNEKLEIPQAWGLAIQKHPLQFQGIKYKSRFNDCSCLALFNRDGIERSLTDTGLGTLSGWEETVDWLDRYRVSLY